MIVKIIQDLSWKKKEWRHGLRGYKKCLTDLEEPKNKQTEMNNTINEMKNTLEGINSRIMDK